MTKNVPCIRLKEIVHNEDALRQKLNEELSFHHNLPCSCLHLVEMH